MLARSSQWRNRKEAEYYEQLADNKVRCTLCPRFCVIPPGGQGFCKSRGNRGGVLYALNYGWIRALNLEHIERIPLIEYYESMGILTIGSFGCNLTCPHCNTWQLVEGPGTGRVLYPNEVVEIASKLLDKDNIGLAYSFNEPTVWYEYVLDCAIEAKTYDMKNVLSTNGVINREPLEKLLPLIDAVNLDIKAMDMEYYAKVLGAPLDVVLQNAKLIKEQGKHLEISTVLLKGINDSEDDIASLVSFIAHELGKDVPLHILSCLPSGRSNHNLTTDEQLLFAADIADKVLENVYVGTP